jgi:Core-2/I-Branching enzyme
MIAYFILVHRLPDQFKRMFEAIYHPANQYLIHVDKNSGPALSEDIAAFLAPYQNTEMLAGRKAQWGGYSLVDAELRGMARLLEMDGKWSHFINLSGQDFPLKSQAYIRNYLIENEGKEYIRILDQAAIRPDTMHRVRHICFEALGRIFRTSIPRKFLKGATPYIGTQWKIVSRGFCEFVCHAPEADRFKHFYKNSFIADESFFQTVMMNGAPHGEIVRDDLRMIDWVPDGVIKLRPRTYGMADAAALLASPDLFARKFDAHEDAGILDVLERHIRKPHVVATVKPVAVRLPLLDPVAAVAA